MSRWSNWSCASVSRQFILTTLDLGILDAGLSLRKVKIVRLRGQNVAQVVSATLNKGFL